MGYRDYTSYQQALWDAWDDTYHARAFGFGHTRKPSPGLVIDEQRFKPWLNKILNQTNIEAQRDLGMRGMCIDDLAEMEMLYLYERMVAADIHNPKIILDD